MPPHAQPRQRRKRTLLLAAAVLLGAGVSLIGAVSSWRKVESFQPLGFTAVPRGGHWLVTSVEDSETLLARGDQILLVGGREAGQISDLGAILRRRPETDLVVARGDDVLAPIRYRRPALEIDWPYLILAVIGAAYLVIGFATLLQDQRRTARLFYLWCLTSTLVYVASSGDLLDPLDRATYLLETAGRVLLAPLTLHLFLVFPRPLGRRWAPFAYLPAAFLLLAHWDAMANQGRWFWQGDLGRAIASLEQLELYHLVVFALTGAAILAWRLLRRFEAEPLRQAIWIAWGLAGGYLPFLAFYLLPRTLGREPGPLQSSLTVLPLALVPLTFAYAILRYRLWDIGPLVRSSLSLSLTVLVGVLGFSLANLAVTRVVPEDLAAARTLLTFASGLAIAGLMIPTRRGLDRSLERVQYRHTFHRRRSLVDFGRDLLHERDLGQLSESLLGQLEETFDLACANLLLRSGQGLVPVRGEPTWSGVVPEEALAEDFWSSDVQALSAVGFAVEPTSPQRQLFAAGYRYALPLRVRDARLGAVVLGYKAGEVPLASDDLDLIRGLLDQVALAVENAQLLEQVRAQLAEVTRLEHYTREIFESSPTGIVVLDPEGRIESANTAFARLVGEPVRPGQPLAEVLPIDPLPEPSEGLREVSLAVPGGGSRYLQLSVASFEAGPRGPRRVVVVADVTDRIAMEAALQERERLASLGLLAAGVAHEVNTPLTGISSYAQLLLADTPVGDPRRALLEKVERQTFRASRIVSNLLELSRERPRETQPVDLGRVVADSLDLLAPRIGGANVRLAWRPPGSPIVVEGNDGELQQVVTNLALNAVEAMAPAGGDLEVTLEADERWVRLAVHDSGPGIPPVELERIFEPFFSTKTGRGGTGLGLAISYTIVHRHGGELRVVSQPGEGACFIVQLPRQAVSR